MAGPWEKYQSASAAEPAQDGPWNKYKTPEQPKQTDSESSGPSLAQQGKSAVQGFGRMASFGQLPTLQAYAEKAIENAAPENDKVKALQDQGFTIVPINKSAQDVRKEYVNYDTEQHDKAPYSYLGGAIDGGLSAGIATGGALAPASPLAGAVIGGAVQGAMNAGPQEFASGEFNPRERGEQALTGAKYGLGGLAAGAVVQKAAQVLPELSQSAAFKALGPYVKQVRDTFKKDAPGNLGGEAKEIGKFVLDNKIVQAGDDIHKIYDKSQAVKEQVGEQIGGIYADAVNIAKSQGKELAFRPKLVGEEFLNSFSGSAKGTPGGDKAINAVKEEVKNFMQLPDRANIKQIHDFRAGLDDLIFDARASQNSPAVKGLLKFREFLTYNIDQNIGDVSQAIGHDMGDQLSNLNRQYSLASSATTIARNKVVHETAKSMVGLRDTGLGGAAGMIAEQALHNPTEAVAVGLATAGASKLARTYGTPVLAKSLQGAGAVTNATTDALQQLSPGQLGAVSEQIKNIKQSTPFQRRMEGRK